MRYSIRWSVLLLGGEQMNDLYEFAAATTDVPWAEAEACGWFNCPDVGGWLRSVTEDEVRYPGGREQAIERMVEEKASAWAAAYKRGPDGLISVFDWAAYMARVLAAAEGREEGNR